MFILNNIEDINFISKKEGAVIKLHHIAEEFSFNSPADFTLETSRPGGSALSALASLHSLGVEGYQRILANLVENTAFMRSILEKQGDIQVCINDTIGYVTMLRLYPKGSKEEFKFAELKNPSLVTKDFSEQVNKYMHEFFSWDFNSRMKNNSSVEYSFSTAFIELDNDVKISGIKLYPVSPHFNKKYALLAVETLIKRKKDFDKIFGAKNEE